MSRRACSNDRLRRSSRAGRWRRIAWRDAFQALAAIISLFRGLDPTPSHLAQADAEARDHGGEAYGEPESNSF